MANNDLPQRRIAVLAIHGVADQKRGDTVQALAELLISQAPNGATYTRGQRSDILLQVPALEPVTDVRTADPSVKKEARQSIRSDYLREGGSAHGKTRTLDTERVDVSQGVAFTSYLLATAKANQKAAETYTMPVIQLRRHTQATDDRVDIFEMYWADLSRLAGNIPTILTELFTFLFRMSQLGRDTVQMQAAVPPFATQRAWRVLRACQTTLDWMYSRVLALLFLQLIMFALILVPLGLALNHQKAVYVVTSAVLVVAVASATLYYRHQPVLALIAGCASAFLLWMAQPASAWVLGAVWLILLGIAYEAWMRVCEERFPLVRVVGNVLGALSAAIVILYAAEAANADLRMWMIGALNGVDRILQLIVYWWFIAGIGLVIWLVSGAIAARSNVVSTSDGETHSVSRAAQARASVATGRMGLVVSLGFFIVLSMTAWALIETTAENATTSVPFTSKAFPTSGRATQSAASAGSTAAAGEQHASEPPPSPGKNEQDDQCKGLENVGVCPLWVDSAVQRPLSASSLYGRSWPTAAVPRGRR